MGAKYEIVAMDRLIAAVQKYQEDLDVNRKILVNAACVCDAAMGSDAIVKKQIGNLNNALEELAATAKIASRVAEALKKDRAAAIRVYEEG